MSTLLYDAVSFCSLEHVVAYQSLFHGMLFLFVYHICLVFRTSQPWQKVSYAYGGSTVAALLVGDMPFLLASNFAIPILALCVLLVDELGWTLGSPNGFIRGTFLPIAFELFRSFIASKWYFHGRAAFGYFEASVLCMIAGTCGSMIANRSVLGPLRNNKAVLCLAVFAFLFYHLFPSSTPEETMFAKGSFAVYMQLVPRALERIVKPPKRD